MYGIKPPGAATKTPQPFTQAQIDASLAANPYAGLGNSTTVFPNQDLSWLAQNGGQVGTGVPGKITAPGYDPDWKALIAGDPTLIAGQADLDLYSGKLGDARTAAIRRAVIEAGLDPGGAFGDIDAATLEAARANKWSGAAELERSRGRGDADVTAALAARGILSSGGLQGGKERVQEGYERGTSQLTNQLLSLITGVQSGYDEKMFGIRSQYQQLREAAALRVQNDPRYQPIGETDAVLDSASGLYMTPDGRWYDRDGKRVTAPAGGRTAPAGAAPAAPPAAVPPPPLPTITSYPVSRPAVNVVPGRDLRAV